MCTGGTGAQLLPTTAEKFKSQLYYQQFGHPINIIGLVFKFMSEDHVLVIALVPLEYCLGQLH